MKYIEINDEGLVWHIPLRVIAEKRADHYADDPDTTREEEIAYVMSDNYEGIDWYRNNMDFEDVEEHAVLISSPKPKSKPSVNAPAFIVDTRE